MKEIEFIYDGADLKNILKKNIFVMKKLDLINNEGPNLRIEKPPTTMEFNIIDQYDVVLETIHPIDVINWIDGRKKIIDSKGKEWVWSENGVDSRTPLVEIIRFFDKVC